METPWFCLQQHVAASANGQNLTYNVVQPMQTFTIDGQEAVFIPPGGGQQMQQVQLAGQTLITPTGQVIRSPTVLSPGLQAGLLQNIAGQTVQFAPGKCFYCATLVKIAELVEIIYCFPSNIYRPECCSPGNIATIISNTAASVGTCSSTNIYCQWTNSVSNNPIAPASFDRCLTKCWTNPANDSTCTFRTGMNFCLNFFMCHHCLVESVNLNSSVVLAANSANGPNFNALGPGSADPTGIITTAE